MIESVIRSAERRVGVSMEYLRTIARASRSAFWKFLLFMPVASHRKVLTPELWHAARIAATQHADCGTCVQITVNLALADQVPADLLRSLVRRGDAALPAPVARIAAFTRATLAQEDATADALREQIVREHGEAALAELALAIATAQVFPLTKRVLGQVKSCSLVQVEIPARA